MAAEDQMVDVPETQKSQSEIDNLRIEDFKQALKQVASGVQQKNERTLGRAWRSVYQFRKALNTNILLSVGRQILPDSDYVKIHQLLTDEPYVNDQMTDSEKTLLPEAYVFYMTFVVIYFIDQQRLDRATLLSSELVEFIDQKLSLVVTANLFSAKAYFYYSYAQELTNNLPSIRPTLLRAFRKATLRHNREGRAMLLNLLLRNYLSEGLYEEGRKLIDRTPDIEFRSTSQQARFHYYEGRIRAIQLDYVNAFSNLETASRKAPASARGFRLSVFKFMIIVQLLMGEIPDRSLFEQPEFQAHLRPYFELTKQVRVGDLATFKEIVNKYRDLFIKDHTLSLIQRIRQNVIRTGLHKISLSYSKISFQDICVKLNLDNPDDVECIVAKAIRDGIIEAVIDHEGGFVRSKDREDEYATLEPAANFDSRITQCMDIQQQATKALRFPPRGFLDAQQQEQREERKKQINDYIKHHTQKENPETTNENE